MATNYISLCTKNHSRTAQIIIGIHEHDSEFILLLVDNTKNVQWIAAIFTKLISILLPLLSRDNLLQSN